MNSNLQRHKTLTNQINAVLLIFTSVLSLLQFFAFDYPLRISSLLAIIALYGIILFLNNLNFNRVARIMTCLVPPLHLLLASLLLKLDYSESLSIIDFFLPRFFILSFIALPFLLLDERQETRTFWVILGINFLSSILFDPLHSWLGVGIERHPNISANYKLLSLYVISGWLILFTSFMLLIRNNRKVAFKLLRRNLQLQDKHEEVKDLMQELKTKNQDLKQNAQLIADKNNSLQQHNETILVKQEQMRRLNVKLGNNELVLRKAYQKLKEREQEINHNNFELQQQRDTLIEQNRAIELQAQELLKANQRIKEISQNQERIIKQKTQELANAYQELDTFLYRASHDFRRPLTTLMGLSELAQIVTQDAAALDLFTKVKVTALGLDKMLEKLRMVSEIGVANHEVVNVDFKRTIQSIRQEFAFLMGERDIEFLSEIETISDLHTAEHLIHIILKNLIENAIIFCKINADPPFIKISVWQDRQLVYVQVEDNGQGIDNTHLDRIFDMYFRGSENSQGNGLGLYVVQKALDQLNARIEIKSTINKGTIFILILDKDKVLS